MKSSSSLKLFILSCILLLSPLVWSVTPISEYNKVIYEVNVDKFSSNGFKGLQAGIPHLKEIGVDIIWMMPIHPIGEQNKINTLGSPYSVKDYKDVNPRFGTKADLKAFIETAHAEGMEVWMDWVANHTAWDHPWNTAATIDYYAKQGAKQPYSPNGWNDVIQLDFSNQDMKNEMINAMKYWVIDFDIDGFRCDYAVGPGTKFWEEAKAAINAIKPSFNWLSEADDSNSNDKLMDIFDFDYAWKFNDKLNDFGKTKKVDELIASCEDLFYNGHYFNKSKMVYLTNHDLNADHGTEFTRYGNFVSPLTVLMFTIYDMPLIYNGQEVGMNKQLSLFTTDPVVWTPVDQQINTLIKKLTTLKRTQPALEGGPNRGSYKRHQTDNANVYAYSRQKGNNEVLTILNFSSTAVNFKFTEEAPEGTFTDYLENAGNKIFDTQTSISIPANGYLIYTTENATEWESETITIRWKQTTENWEKMAIYGWGGTPNYETFGGWPGLEVVVDTDGWYTATYPKTNDINIILNNTSGGTGNQFDFVKNPTDNTCFEISTTTFNSQVVDCPPSGNSIHNPEEKEISITVENDIFQVESNHEISRIEIIDLQGRKIFSELGINQNQWSLKLPELKSVVIVKVQTSKSVYCKKFVLSK